VLGKLGLAADRPALEEYLARNRSQRHGSRHTYTAADFGLSEEKLEQDFAFYQEVAP
jgi:hypothetical protein